MMFASRQDAGQRLGRYLNEEGIEADLVLGLPRGGVVVAAEVARTLQLPLDVIVVRKIGHPLQREFAIGALAQDGVVVLDEPVIARNPINRADLNAIVEEETERLRTYEVRFNGDRRPEVAGKTALIVDDGLATGATMEAAVLSVKKQEARRIVVAVPVTSRNAMDRIARAADEVRALCVDPEFEAVGRYYASFSQTTDEEVVELLRTEAKRA
jgi:putative phosphoribosyl transferase